MRRELRGFRRAWRLLLLRVEGMRVGKRKAILFTILGGMVALVLWNSMYKTAPGPAASPVSALRQSKAVAAQPAAKAEAKPLALALPERPTLGEPAGVLFGSQSWQPPAPKTTAARVAPSAPPLPYRFAGKLVRDGTLQVFLAKGNVAIPIKQGQILDGAYRVETIGEDRVTLVYLPLNHKDSIALRYALPTAAARPVAGIPRRGAGQPD